MKRLIRHSENIFLKDIMNPINNNQYSTDFDGRDFALVMYDDLIFSGDTHSNIINQQMSDLNLNEGYYCMGSYIKGIDGNDYIALYPHTCTNIDINTAAEIFKEYYPNAIICEDRSLTFTSGAYITKLL